MFDSDTASLIASAPPLEGLNLQQLPQDLTAFYAQIVSARIRLRELTSENDISAELVATVRKMRRLASTNEALVSTVPNRDDRAAAAFVAGSAHHACMLANSLEQRSPSASYFGVDSISAEISATLLFLIAEASADAAEMAKHIIPSQTDQIEGRLSSAIRDLALGQLHRIVDPNMPSVEAISAADPGLSASKALYFHILRGVRALAREMLEPANTELFEQSASEIFAQVISLSTEPIEHLPFGGPSPLSIFPGPLHLASLLSAVARDFPSSAVVHIKPPDDLNNDRWHALMKQIARDRPYIWRNHKQAIDGGYLEAGVSSVISFPTGGGKSKLSELKIAASLLRGTKVVFLAPTLALVDQTATALAKTFPQAQIQQERAEQSIFSPTEAEELPGISVVTPERCLSMLSFSPEAFTDVGLVVFDECHLLHPRESDTSRRSIDAMLCLLNLQNASDSADILLLSAMVQNTAELSSWIEEITHRPCLALDLKWKPTRQVRGCVVYESERINELRKKLSKTRQEVDNKNPPASLKRELNARPFGFFCLRQTWNSNSISDYTLLPLSDNLVTLSTGTVAKTNKWYLTPNGNRVSASIASATAEQGLKTLIFAQTIPLCKSTSDNINETRGDQSIQLTSEEQALLLMSIDELASASHLYIEASDNVLKSASACHHGLLIAPERQLHESLFRRKDGINALVATSTLAQGMNLPSEVVIIAGDSRFDSEANRMQQLEAHELLNAAGRAGRAGETSQGFVLIVPSKVVDFESKNNQIHDHWSSLRAIFSQSDQCLTIDDPFTALLDQIHHSSTEASQAAQYLLSRLPVGSVDDDDGADAPARALLKRSFGVFRAKKKNNLEWISSRIDAAIQLRNSNPSITNTWLDQIAATSGISTVILSRMTQSLLATAASTPSTTEAWAKWMFSWLRSNPQDILALIRNETLEGMLGKPYKDISEDQARGSFAIDVIERVLPYWMNGAALSVLEHHLGTPAKSLGHCEKAREFTLRIVPEVAYIFGIIPQLYQTLFALELDTPPALATIGAVVREGYDSPEKLALRQVIGRKYNRRAVHRLHAKVAPLASPAMPNEDFAQLVDRVRDAWQLLDFLES